MIPTIHINISDKNKIAKTVIMPGDPLRAKFIVENFFDEYELVTSTRNMLGYTGLYKGKKYSVIGSGMGMASIGIYAYELYKYYDVDNIIRIGSAGGIGDDVTLMDVVVVDSAYSDTVFAKVSFENDDSIIESTAELTNELIASARELDKKIVVGRVSSSDALYKSNVEAFYEKVLYNKCIATEMEAFGLFACAKYFNKSAACLVTIAGHPNQKTRLSSFEREQGFIEMINIVLNIKK